jgi:hypothetical protein
MMKINVEKFNYQSTLPQNPLNGKSTDRYFPGAIALAANSGRIGPERITRQFSKGEQKNSTSQPRFFARYQHAEVKEVIAYHA